MKIYVNTRPFIALLMVLQSSAMEHENSRLSWSTPQTNTPTALSLSSSAQPNAPTALSLSSSAQLDDERRASRLRQASYGIEDFEPDSQTNIKAAQRFVQLRASPRSIEQQSPRTSLSKTTQPELSSNQGQQARLGSRNFFSAPIMPVVASRPTHEQQPITSYYIENFSMLEWLKFFETYSIITNHGVFRDAELQKKLNVLGLFSKDFYLKLNESLQTKWNIKFIPNISPPFVRCMIAHKKDDAKNEAVILFSSDKANGSKSQTCEFSLCYPTILVHKELLMIYNSFKSQINEFITDISMTNMKLNTDIKVGGRNMCGGIAQICTVHIAYIASMKALLYTDKSALYNNTLSLYTLGAEKVFASDSKIMDTVIQNITWNNFILFRTMDNGSRDEDPSAKLPKKKDFILYKPQYIQIDKKMSFSFNEYFDMLYSIDDKKIHRQTNQHPANYIGGVYDDHAKILSKIQPTHNNPYHDQTNNKKYGIKEIKEIKDKEKKVIRPLSNSLQNSDNSNKPGTRTLLIRTIDEQIDYRTATDLFDFQDNTMRSCALALETSENLLAQLYDKLQITSKPEKNEYFMNAIETLWKENIQIAQNIIIGAICNKNQNLNCILQSNRDELVKEFFKLLYASYKGTDFLEDLYNNFLKHAFDPLMNTVETPILPRELNRRKKQHKEEIKPITLELIRIFSTDCKIFLDSLGSMINSIKAIDSLKVQLGLKKVEVQQENTRVRLGGNFELRMNFANHNILKKSFATTYREHCFNYPELLEYLNTCADKRLLANFTVNCQNNDSFVFLTSVIKEPLEVVTKAPLEVKQTLSDTSVPDGESFIFRTMISEEEEDHSVLSPEIKIPQITSLHMDNYLTKTCDHRNYTVEMIVIKQQQSLSATINDLSGREGLSLLMWRHPLSPGGVNDGKMFSGIEEELSNTSLWKIAAKNVDMQAYQSDDIMYLQPNYLIAYNLSSETPSLYKISNWNENKKFNVITTPFVAFLSELQIETLLYLSIKGETWSQRNEYKEHTKDLLEKYQNLDMKHNYKKLLVENLGRMIAATFKLEPAKNHHIILNVSDYLFFKYSSSDIVDIIFDSVKDIRFMESAPVTLKLYILSNSEEFYGTALVKRHIINMSKITETAISLSTMANTANNSFSL